MAKSEICSYSSYRCIIEMKSGLFLWFLLFLAGFSFRFLTKVFLLKKVYFVFPPACYSRFLCWYCGLVFKESSKNDWLLSLSSPVKVTQHDRNCNVNICRAVSPHVCDTCRWLTSYERQTTTDYCLYWITWSDMLWTMSLTSSKQDWSCTMFVMFMTRRIPFFNPLNKYSATTIYPSI